MWVHRVVYITLEAQDLMLSWLWGAIAPVVRAPAAKAGGPTMGSIPGTCSYSVLFPLPVGLSAY